MNRIELSKGENSSREVAMSNGLTAVVITTFGLSAVSVAKTDTQKSLAVFILEKDQSYVGLGAVGFSLSEMPWKLETFIQDKKFFLQVLVGIKQEVGWQTLNYEPSKELLFPIIDQLIGLVGELTKDQIDEEAAVEWLAAAEEDDPVVNGFPMCEKHRLLLSLFGCHACNDE